MTRRGRAQTLAASPIMVGAVTVLVTVVAVFLAYQANTGLPFVPTYKVSAQVPNADTLVPGNEVRIGGVQVGVVEAIDPVAGADGSASAKLDLKLDRSVEPLPEDTTVIVRSRSALGLKYLELDRGDSEQGLTAGSTLPLSAARPEPIEIDEVLSTFDDPTRAAIQVNLREFGTALAGRGADLNAAIEELRPLVEVLEPVMRNLASPRTRLGRFVSALSVTAAEVAPVAENQARLFVSLERTFGALADVARPYLQETISRTPPTLDVATASLPRIRPFLRHSEDLFAKLRPGFEALRPTAPQVADALVVGVPALRAAPAFNAQLPPTAQSLVDLAEDATSREGIDDLTEAMDVLGSALAFIAPAQSVCNYGTLLLRNLADAFSLGNGIGTWQRVINISAPLAGEGANNEGVPSSAPASGPAPDNNLHFNPYPNTAAAGQTRECEAGNEPYTAGRPLIGNPAGNQGTKTEDQPPKKKKKKRR